MPQFKVRWDYNKYERWFLIFSRAVTVGVAYVTSSPITGLTSSFVAIFAALLSFDIFVASERPPVGKQDWQHFFQALRPRILSTAITLAKGSLTGAFFGLLALLGLPHVIGAVLTCGLSYVWAINTRHAISTYVSILSGLALFERLISLEQVETLLVVSESLATITLSSVGTFAGLVAGWGVGLIAGGITRGMIRRPYRSLKSAAYDPPLEMRPFNEVMHIGQRSIVIPVVVEPGAPIAGKSLAESGLRENFGATVLSIIRGKEQSDMPKGHATLEPGDQITLLADKEFLTSLYDQFKTAEPDENDVADEDTDAYEDAEASDAYEDDNLETGMDADEHDPRARQDQLPNGDSVMKSS